MAFAVVDVAEGGTARRVPLGPILAQFSNVTYADAAMDFAAGCPDVLVGFDDAVASRRARRRRADPARDYPFDAFAASPSGGRIAVVFRRTGVAFFEPPGTRSVYVVDVRGEAPTVARVLAPLAPTAEPTEVAFVDEHTVRVGWVAKHPTRELARRFTFDDLGTGTRQTLAERFPDAVPAEARHERAFGRHVYFVESKRYLGPDRYVSLADVIVDRGENRAPVVYPSTEIHRGELLAPFVDGPVEGQDVFPTETGGVVLRTSTATGAGGAWTTQWLRVEADGLRFIQGLDAPRPGETPVRGAPDRYSRISDGTVVVRSVGDRFPPQRWHLGLRPFAGGLVRAEGGYVAAVGQHGRFRYWFLGDDGSSRLVAGPRDGYVFADVSTSAVLGLSPRRSGASVDYLLVPLAEAPEPVGSR